MNAINPSNIRPHVPTPCARARKKVSSLALALLALGGLVAPATSRAALLAYEGFDYAAATGGLPGQSGGAGWAGSWQTVGGAGANVVASSLAAGANAPAGYDGYSVGNSVIQLNGTRAGRSLDTSAGGPFGFKGYLTASGNIGAAGKTIYISFLQQPNGTSLYYEFEFHRGDLGDPGRIGGVGNDQPGNNVNLRTGGTQTLIGPGSTGVNFYVVRIDFLGGNDTVMVYQNPTSATEPGTPTLLKTDAGDMSFNGISFGAYVNNRTVAHDEVRLGETWVDVMGPASPLVIPPMVWMGDGSANNWDFTAANWTQGSGRVAFQDLFSVVFDDSGSATPAVNLASSVSPNNVTFSNSVKNYTITGGGSINASGALIKANDGTVTLSLNTTLAGSASLRAGKLAVNNAATLQSTATSGLFAIGDGGTATLDVSGFGTTVSPVAMGWTRGGGFQLGTRNGSSYGNGTLNLADGTVHVSSFTAGVNGGTGTIVQNSGDVVVDDFFSLGLGSDAGVGTASYQIKAGTLTVAGDWSVNEGKSNDCTFAQSGGAVTLNGNNNFIGRAGTGGKGIYNLSGGTLTSAKDLQVAGGNTGANGVLYISGNAQLNLTDVFALVLGRSSSSTGTISQVGGTVNIPSTSTLGLWLGAGTGARATYNLDGGTLALGKITPNAGAASAELAFSGGTLQLLGGFTLNSVANFTTVINAGGANFDLAGQSLVWMPALLAGTGTGGLTVADTLGGGTLTLNGANTYKGATRITGGTLGGTGTLLGPLTIAAGATLAPGANGIGTLNVSNNVTLQGATLMEIGRSGPAPVSDLVAGVTTLTFGGTLTVVTNASLGAFAPGDTFKLFGAAAYQSQFALVTLPQLPDGWTWDASKLGVDGTIKAVGQVTDVTIVAEPQNLVLPVGGNGSFVVGAAGAPPLSYQWYHNGVPVPGGNSATLNIVNARTTAVGEYYVVINNSLSTATSATVSLALSMDRLLAYEPFDYSAGTGNLPGQAGGFGWGAPWQAVDGSGGSVGSGSLLGGTNVPAGYDARSLGNCSDLPTMTRDGRYLDINPGGPFDANGYLDVNGNIGADGKTIYLSFLQQPNGTDLFYEFEIHRVNLSDPGRIGGIGNDQPGGNVNLRTGGTQTPIGPGSTNVNFYVVRIDFQPGNDDVRVYMNPTSATEPATPTLTMLGASDMSFNGISFGAWVNGRTVRHDQLRVGTTWAAVLGAPSGPPVILAQPQDPRPFAGQNATFTVVAGGSAPFDYYWTKDSAPFAVTTTGSLTIPNVPLAYSGSQFSVTVSNEFGTVTSAAVPLSVLQGAANVTLAASPNPATEGANVSFTATLSQTAATGTVTFKDGGAPVSTVEVAGGQALFNTRALALGTHAMTATYNGDANYGASTSAVVNVTIQLGSAALPSGVVAYYPFDSSGIDASGQNNHLARASGAVQFMDASGPFGGSSLYLDGSTTLGTVSGLFPTGVPTGANPYTVACFVKADASSSANGGWIGYGTGAFMQCNNFRFGGNFHSIWNYWWAADTGAEVPNGGDFTTAWHTVVGTWDGTTRSIYIDGLLQNSDTPGAPNITSASFVVGKTLGDANLKGWLAELLIANRAFSLEEVRAYNTAGGLSASPVPNTPTSLTFKVNGDQLTVSWPSNYLGWILQGQTNPSNVGLGNNWADIPGTALVTSTNLPISPANAAAFYRLRHP